MWIPCRLQALLLLFAVLAVCPQAVVSVLLDQPPDFLNRYPSFYVPSGTQKGDDFRPAEPVIVESVTFWMVATYPNTPWTYSFSVHRGFFDHPIYEFAPDHPHFFRMFNPSLVTDLGPWPGDETLHLFEVRFDNIGLRLEPGLGDLGVYWFCCGGHLLDYPRDKCFVATAGFKTYDGDMGYTKLEPWDWPGWIRMDSYDVPPSDFAMRIEGVPASEYQPTTELVSFKLITGQHSNGDLEGLREAGDGKRMAVESRPRGPGHRHRITGQAMLRCLVKDSDLLDVAVSANAENFFGEAPATVSLRNWSTGEYDVIGTYTVAYELVTWALRDITARHYVRVQDGMIDLRFEFDINARRMDFQFLAHIDRIRIDARRED